MQSSSVLQRLLRIAVLLVGIARSLGDLPLGPAQIKRIAEVRAAAIGASDQAEKWLLQQFDSLTFRAGLFLQGDAELASSSSEQLIARIKDTLASMEYLTNFGVEAAWRKEHPGDSAMDLKTVEEFGHIPTMWELKAANSTLVNGTPAAEWAILDAAETGLYGLQGFTNPIPQGPSAGEAKERPQYLSANLRRLDVGVARYGPYLAIVRESVVRERTLLISSDSGGWENGCNSSVTPISRWFPMIAAIAFHCSSMFNAWQGGHPGIGVLDHQLHTLIGNQEIFSKGGVSLPRLVYQMLSPTATLRPIETLMYTEGGLLGPLRMQDMKLIVASLPGLFGSDQADELRAFCQRHGVPLAWGISTGESWMSEHSHTLEWFPYSPVHWSEGKDRLLDPISWNLTNATPPAGLRAIQVEWKIVEADVRITRSRQGKQRISQNKYFDWWERLTRMPGGVRSLRGRECADPDFCFGTLVTETGNRDCIRSLPQAAATSNLVV